MGILGVFAVFICATVLSLIGTTLSPGHSKAAASSTINFQARLETSSGSIAPDGNYNVEFNLYNVSGGGTTEWTEDYLNNNSQGVHVVNGYLTVNLGAITSFPGTINWTQQQYLTMNIGNTNGTCTPFSTCSPDGEMSPRLTLTATPYSFQAGELVATNGIAPAKQNATLPATLDR